MWVLALERWRGVGERGVRCWLLHVHSLSWFVNYAVQPECDALRLMMWTCCVDVSMV